MFNSFYKNKKVLVTGDTGFKGSWMCLWLLSLGARVIGYALDPITDTSFFEELALDKKIKHITADIRDEEQLTKIILDEQPDIIFHMAAQALVRYSYFHPKETYETNVLGTINVFEAARKLDKPVVLINITSDKCYENLEKKYHYKETDSMGGFDPYSNSKGCAELVTTSYRNSFFNPKDYGRIHNVALASVRAGNVIGGGDWSENRLIPDCVRALSKNETIEIKSPNAIRPWQFALEPLSGYLQLASVITDDLQKYATGWNFGPTEDSSLSVEEVVKEVLLIWKGDYIVNAPDALHEANLLMLDIAKAKKELGWNPAYSAKQAIDETVEWYKRFYENKENMFDFSIKQIEKYENARLNL